MTRDEALSEALNLAMTRADLYDIPADLIAARAAMARAWLEIADRLLPPAPETGLGAPGTVPEWNRSVGTALLEYARCSHGNICLINGDHLVHAFGDRCTDPPDPRWTHEERSC